MAVRAHVEALHVERDAARQPDDAHLRRHVVGLAEIADQARRRGHVDHRAGVLLAEMRRAGAAHGERAVQMHHDDVGPVRPAHAVEYLVAQDAGVVDQDVDAAEGVERGLARSCRRSAARRSTSVEAMAWPPAFLISSTTCCAGPASPPEPSSAAPTSLTRTLAPSSAISMRDGAADAAARAGDDGDFAFDDAWHVDSRLTQLVQSSPPGLTRRSMIIVPLKQDDGSPGQARR